ncbi:Hypothetical protein F387_02028 [Wohlfahrtiimonas chitiniclastica SH04]|uniref:Uncharacterized protein n=2 Tax=Wohlfahrtiimonas chitiniclastica TaxID=400946 RepID=L8XWM4_9GAMM|nr:hypothetical protein [Wohlfahrtiimonas chitiniclastica]ELV07209.1 Hypothetical protein F387_02028 [Wohlfahrtiimonas chitiniclastica SH04]MBS7821612.1 hypothetical protein [Wohlfahrtiimonas chitiniclastica]
MINNIHATILKNLRDDGFMSEEVKSSMIKIEINEHYEQITSNHSIVDENSKKINEMDFKQTLYCAFNIEDV